MPHFSAFAAETPDRPAYIMANSGEVVTYAELDRRSNQVAHLLRASGVNRGDHIAIMMKNCTEFLQVAQGALRAGIIFTPISTHLKQDETAYIITNCKAKLFVASASLAEVATEAAAAAGGLGRCLSVGGDIAGFERLDEELARLPETPIEDEFLGAPMLYSSGTTGKPKGVYWEPTQRASIQIIRYPAALALSLALVSTPFICRPRRSITRHLCTTTSWCSASVAPR